MDVVISKDVERASVAVRGEVDADNRDEMGRAIIEGTDGASRVEVDLSGLSFIDSSGLGELLRVNELLVERGQQIEIVNPSEPLLRILEITGLLEHFGLSKAT